MSQNQSMHTEIRDLVESFATELEALVRRAALEQLHSALGGATSVGRQTRGPGRKASGSRGTRGKRSTEQVGAFAVKILEVVKKKPGLRGEQLSKEMRTDTKSLRLPMLKLIGDKKVKTKGQRRGMTYFAA
jgi:hypothetical protein